MAGRAQRSGWTLLLGAALAAVAVASLLTFSILARKTSLGDAPGPGVTVAQAGPTPGTIDLPSPSPTGGTGADEPVAPVELPVGLPAVDGITAPRLAAFADGSGGDGGSSRRAKNSRNDGGNADADRPGRGLAKGHDKPGGPVHASGSSGGSNERRFASSTGGKKAHGPSPHSNGKGKGHEKRRGKGHARHH